MRTLLLASAACAALLLAGCGEEPAAKPNDTGAASGPAPGTQPTPGSAAAATVPADNSGRNARDDGTTITPVDQGMSAGDLAITRAVRQGVVANKGISINGQNVKIMAKDGIVTLRGPVASEGERSTIVDLAERAPEVKAVVNQLEVAP